eukprot:ANDGO_03291.mRNA.1 putative U6 snRNA-associated Sm-like protein LSm5
MTERMQPLGLVDQCMNRSIWVVMKSDLEFTGTLIGFDDHVNLVLQNATEYAEDSPGSFRVVSKRDTMMLNGNQIAALIPGGKGPVAS